jgi:adenosylhomocysteine nucleosidase
MIGIIGAMAIEVEFLVDKLTEKSTATYSGTSYVSGKYGEADVVVAHCGMGKVNAAVCTQTMILKYSPKIIINTGVAGALSDELVIGDIIIGKKAVQCDLDLRPIGLAKGFIKELDTIYMNCTPSVVKRLESAARKYDRYRVGVVASSDQFVSRDEKKAAIASDFTAIACEMEGASIAHVCMLGGVEFGIVRTISDNANDSSVFDFKKFMQQAAEKSVQIICNFLEDNA